MREFLAEFEEWDRVLVTNAPRDGTVRLLTVLEVQAGVDHVIGDARKPQGLRALTAPGGELDLRLWRRVLSIGDIWRNDLEPVSGRATTALVERHPQPAARPTLRAAQVEDLFAPLAHWRTNASTTA